MKSVIITPTHNTKYLEETYQSLLSQTDKDWVWLLIVNGEALQTNNNFGLSNVMDSRIIIEKYTETNFIIGAVKKFGFEKAIELGADILIELDHDDLLTPNAVEEIKKAFIDPNIGFVYSNYAEFNDVDWSTFHYNHKFGWTYYQEEHNAHKLDIMNTWNPTPHSIGYIWYAPNHVRAWRKSAYINAGMHDPTMKACDDHDLICRTYFVTTMKVIRKCLYLYRNYKEQSFRVYNKFIQDETRRIHDKYFIKLARRWAVLNNYKCIDLGAAHHKPYDWIGVDLYNADIKANLNKKWPFKNNSVGVIRASDIVEHLKDPIHVMNEAYRVLIDGGIFIVYVPSSEGRGSCQDPTHVSFWNENSFWYYTDPFYSKFVRAIKCKFQVIRTVTYYPTEFHKLNKIPYVAVHLSAYKKIRYPGILKWEKAMYEEK